MISVHIRNIARLCWAVIFVRGEGEAIKNASGEKCEKCVIQYVLGTAVFFLWAIDAARHVFARHVAIRKRSNGNKNMVPKVFVNLFDEWPVLDVYAQVGGNVDMPL